VCKYPNTRFPGWWIGRAATITWPPRSPDLAQAWIFCYGDFLKIECSYHFFLQMSLSSEPELLPQFQKWRQRCYIACGKKLTPALPVEVTLNNNCPS
jgi:hypothetical protein